MMASLAGSVENESMCPRRGPQFRGLCRSESLTSARIRRTGSGSRQVLSPRRHGPHVVG